MSEHVTEHRKAIPFYGSYASFYRALQALKEKAVPRRIETRTLAPLLDEAREASRIVAGFSSIGWIDEDGFPTDKLRKLVASFGEETWEAAVAEVTRSTYTFIRQNWEELTPELLHDDFVSYTGRDVEVLKSSETFFICLAYEGGTQLHESLYRRAVRAVSDAKRYSLLGKAIESRADSKETAAPASAGELSSAPLNDRSLLARLTLDLTALAITKGKEMAPEELSGALAVMNYLRRVQQ